MKATFARRYSVFLTAMVFLTIARSGSPRAETAGPPQPPAAQAPSAAVSPPKTAESPAPQADPAPPRPPASIGEVRPGITPVPEASKQPQVVQCNCTPAKDDGHWTGKDLAALLTGLGGLLGVAVAALAIWSNGRTSRATTIQKANETELDSLESKLDNFYGPYLQLSSTNRLIATDLKSRHPSRGQMRILLLLLDPAWKQNFKPGDIAFVEEILSIDAKLLELIQEKSGLTSSAVQPYLWRAASHFRIIKLASEGKLENDSQRYAHYVYPQQLDEILELETQRIHGRINLIRGNPMVLHPPAPELAIPERLRLAAWPGSPGS